MPAACVGIGVRVQAGLWSLGGVNFRPEKRFLRRRAWRKASKATGRSAFLEHGFEKTARRHLRAGREALRHTLLRIDSFCSGSIPFIKTAGSKAAAGTLPSREGLHYIRTQEAHPQAGEVPLRFFLFRLQTAPRAP